VKNLTKLYMMLVMIAFSAAAEKSMNVIFILADDLGWADTTLYGHTQLYKTPNLERLAKRGMTFTHAYSDSPLCSPTRASILTGQSPARTGFTSPEGHSQEVRLKPAVRQSVPPGYKSKQVESVTRLDTRLPTLGKLVKQAGYATGHFGKWHVGHKPYSPLEHGFDIDLPPWPGPGPGRSFLAPWSYETFKENVPGEHIEDRMAEEAVQWMKSVADDKPFYMNYWQFSVHAPFDAKKELIEKYRKKIDLNDPQRSPTYAAMVESMDDAVGTLLDAVDAMGIADETVIIFVSDNGGNMYNTVDGTSPTSNAPLRGGKATVWEGGTRVPCVVVWPGVTESGSCSDVPIQTSDFYPTLLNGLGIGLPENHVIDSVDLAPVLQGGSLDRTEIYTYFPQLAPVVPDWLPSSIAVRSGDWKLIRVFYYGENGAHDYKLFNLKTDLGEKNNVAASSPERVQRLDRLIDHYLERTGAVIPLPNENFNTKKYLPENIGVPLSKQKIVGLVGGWIEGGSSSLEPGDGTAVLESFGNDPFFSVHKMKPFSGGPFTLSFRMKSDSAGKGLVFYGHPPAKERSISFAPKHNGRWEEFTIQIPETKLTGLRIDPATAKGIIEFDWIRLMDASGKTVQEWRF
jgi:arylsulfatase A-like enzyme